MKFGELLLDSLLAETEWIGWIHPEDTAVPRSPTKDKEHLVLELKLTKNVDKGEKDQWGDLREIRHWDLKITQFPSKKTSRHKIEWKLNHSLPIITPKFRTKLEGRPVDESDVLEPFYEFLLDMSLVGERRKFTLYYRDPK